MSEAPDPCVLERDVLNRVEEELESHRRMHGPNVAQPTSGQEPAPTYPQFADERKVLADAVTTARENYRLCMESNGLPLDRPVTPESSM